MGKEDLLSICFCIGCCFAGAYSAQGQVIVAVVLAGACICFMLRRNWKRDRDYRGLQDTINSLWKKLCVERNRNLLIDKIAELKKPKETVQ